MQYKHPELLWALFLLLIPIIVHLFQLRKFKRTPFTNVQLLQKVVSQSRKSSTLKKWLLLATRILLFTALVIAFAQPFLSSKTALQEKETVIYLDNSFSLQAIDDNETKLNSGIQQLIKSLPKDETFTLFTNDKVFRDVKLKDIQNELLALEYSNNQLRLNDIYLKGSTFFDASKPSLKNLVVISDFQEVMASKSLDSSSFYNRHLVQLESENLDNISLDSIYISSNTPDNIEMEALLSAHGEIEDTPVSIYNNGKLIAKTAAQFNNNKAKVSFTVPDNTEINGSLEISDAGLSYDNVLYFNVAPKEKIKILAINGVEDNFLTRIFTDDEFVFSGTPLNKLDYSAIDEQQMIILNELEEIPTSLASVLSTFKENGGSLLVIPSRNSVIASYNAFLNGLYKTGISQKIEGERNIVSINFSHPLYQNVFDKKVVNFQYPKVSEFYAIKTEAPQLLSYENSAPFLVGAKGFYFFTAPLSEDISNFKNSPLIVPTLYTMGMNSLKMADLYEILGQHKSIDIPVSLGKDQILKLSQKEYEVIPEQKSYTNKTTLSFTNVPNRDGLFSINENGRTLKNISFNNPRNESELRFMDMDNLSAISTSDSINSLFLSLEKENSITELWKWFIIFALLFMLVEVLIQKILK
ncbi:BatA domain-containing protein [Sediminicola sp. 1XM1-17]|uniref:BatA domain-containing protein n=1 Tax=Sediminicola sp. 1XM1-17 TaxID=3127702 RepID=UPI003077FC42